MLHTIYGLIVPPRWKAIQSHLEHLTGHTIIMAGGCHRDADHDEQVKDVDLFLKYSQDAFDIIDLYFEREGWVVKQYVDGSSCEDMSDVELVVAYAPSDHADETEFNVIFMKGDVTLKDCLGRIDFGICQIGSGSRDIHPSATKAYLNDKRDRTFTLTRADPTGRSAARFERLSVKYPGWRMRPYQPSVQYTGSEVEPFTFI